MIFSLRNSHVAFLDTWEQFSIVKTKAVLFLVLQLQLLSVIAKK